MEMKGIIDMENDHIIQSTTLGIITPSCDIHVRGVGYFEPQPDITAYENAKLMIFLLSQTIGNSFNTNTHYLIDNNLMRHFTKE
jgi:hypothetical protein